MANSNTLHAQKRGYSGLTAMKRGNKDFKQPGPNVDSHILRKKSGKKKWSPPQVKKGKKGAEA